jgi:hypothetical protein
VFPDKRDAGWITSPGKPAGLGVTKPPRLIQGDASMELPPFNAEESACIKHLADRFEDGDRFCDDETETAEELNIDREKYRTIIRMLGHLGYLHLEGEAVGTGIMFNITPSMVVAARLIAAREEQAKASKDLVTQMTVWAQQHRLIAWLILIFVVITAGLTLFNQVVQFLRNIRVIQ